MPVSPCCFSLSSSLLVSNLASIFSCSLSFILQLLCSKILPFSVSLVLPLTLLISKIAPSFSIPFLLPLALLVSKIVPPFSIPFLLSLPLLVTKKISDSRTSPNFTLVCLWCGRTGSGREGGVRSREYQIFWGG